MTTPLEKIAEEKNGNYQSLLKGGGGGAPLIGKRPIYFRFFLLKASLREVLKTNKKILEISRGGGRGARGIIDGSEKNPWLKTLASA